MYLLTFDNIFYQYCISDKLKKQNLLKKQIEVSLVHLEIRPKRKNRQKRNNLKDLKVKGKQLNNIQNSIFYLKIFLSYKNKIKNPKLKTAEYKICEKGNSVNKYILYVNIKNSLKAKIDNNE